MAKTTFVVDKEKLEVRMSRTFDAPRELVWKALTDPTMIPKWWGPRNLTTTIDKLDFRVGGEWRFIHKDQDGNEYAFRGAYKEIVEPETVTNTFEYEPMAGHILTESFKLEEVEGKTTINSVSKYANIEDLEGMVASGMEQGAVEGYERLAELVESK